MASLTTVKGISITKLDSIQPPVLLNKTRTIYMLSTNRSSQHNYDRLKEVTQFDQSKIGVKGLLDTGIKTIPCFFHQPPENLDNLRHNNKSQLTVPVIDMSQDRSKVVEQVRKLSSTLGFFQIVNHGVEVKMIESVLNDVKSFYEAEDEYKMRFAYFLYAHVVFLTLGRDKTLYVVRMSPIKPDWEALPEMCRAALADWDKAVVGLGEELMSMLCEGLGVKSNKLKKLSCLEGRANVSHYYPQCPQPDLTLGITSHTDPGVLTVLVQNEVGGLLQVKCGEDWAAVKAVPGAIVINIGDLLQIMSNDEYISVEHRVLANPEEAARVSIAVFLTPSIRENLYGPFPELIYAEKTAVYKEFTFADYLQTFFTKELDGKSLTNFYKIDDTKG
ncbi:1-aminocyclopropane-1-carboxylate oxidase homolog 3-like protein [Tanacetum coccineum]